jgi:hypothetical protein
MEGGSLKKGLLVMAVAALAASLALPVLADSGNKYDNTTATQDCGNDSTVTYAGPLKLWPPNHKYVPFSVTITDDSGDDVSLATEVTHEEYAEDGSELNGAGNTTDDANPAAAESSGSGTTTNNHEVRSERSGRGDGRTYTVSYEGTADNGLTQCMGTFEILVPHDMRGGADWK